MHAVINKPTSVFVGASWAVKMIGCIGFCIGLWRSILLFNEKGYYLALLCFGLFAVVSLQKTVHDRLDNIPVTGIYYGIC